MCDRVRKSIPSRSCEAGTVLDWSGRRGSYTHSSVVVIASSREAGRLASAGSTLSHTIDVLRIYLLSS